ncbi:MAG: PASTA domain-containing protein [Coriobacteriales bacterium]|nr:PASTA domain-containing protein [Coriobacteriales bacterium]
MKVSFKEQATESAALIDRVVNQDPAAGTPVTKGSTITVYIGIKPSD